MRKALALLIAVLAAVVFSSCTYTTNNYYEQKDAAASSEAATESKPTEQKPAVSSAPADSAPQSTPKTNTTKFDDNTPFYGIWVYASKSYDEAADTSAKVSSNGFSAYVEDTTHWNNLNSENWYVVTAGKYASEDEANSELANVKKHYPDAYVKYSGDYIKASGYQPPFYGIWVSASKNYDDATKTADKVSSYGFDGYVEDTTNWSNLNSEKWYVVTAGRYASEKEANNKLAEVKEYYPDAYVKYSGDYTSD